MKKIILLIIAVLLFSQSALIVSADDRISGDLDDAIDSVINGITDEDLNDLVNELNEIFNDEKTLKDRLISFITGENDVEFLSVITVIKKVFSSSFKEVISILSCVVLIAILYSVINIINYKKYDNNENNAIYFICYTLVATTYIQLISKVMVVGTGLIESVSKTVEIAFPFMVALSEFSGGFGTALFKPLSSIATVLSSELFSSVFIPIISVCFICVIVGNLTDTIKLANLNKTLLSLIKWILGIVTIVFTLTVTAKSVINGQYNGLSFKILKYTTGSMIPIVGNFISGGLDVLTSSAILVKNSLGLIVVILIIFTVLKAGLTVLVVSFLLKFAISICEPILDGKFVKLTGGLCEIFNVFSAIIFFSGFVYVLVCFSIINSTALII